MKIKVNRNILWTEIFVKNIIAAGVKYACISPGSRSTPLTYAFASNPGIKSYVFIDERSAAFFASGLARKTGTPVVLICTSGTAAAEFYPGIIEAYQQRIPLIVCTADRPDGSFLIGLNQTINQINIYSNHIRWFVNAELPDINKLDFIARISADAAQKSISLKGPVHINFPFDKPFEPDKYTDEIDVQEFVPVPIGTYSNPGVNKATLQLLSEEIISEPKGFIAVGPSDFNENFRNILIELSELSGYPILADGASQIRSGNNANENIITNFEVLFRGTFFSKIKPEIILHFGRAMTSKGYEDFLLKYHGKKYLINKYNDAFDASGRYNALIGDDELQLAAGITNFLQAKGFKRKNSPWLDKILDSERILCDLKEKTINNSDFPDEGRLISETVNTLPPDWNIMLSNSSPIRDFDYFSGQLNGRYNIYHNRGASGIDGIISTALGISSFEGNTVLITGDLAFYHDLNGLLASAQNKIPLVIILINNNGGGIFRTLPVSGYKDIFSKFFTTPHNLNFRSFVEAYGGSYRKIENWENYKSTLTEAVSSDKLFVIEIETDPDLSLARRREFWEKAEIALNDNSII